MLEQIPLKCGEIIKTIEGYEGLYSVTSHGRIYAHKKIINNRIFKPIFLKFRNDKDNYLLVNLSKNNKRTTYRVHRLVAQIFIKNYKNLFCINHKDGNKQNNHVDNLEWCSSMENNYHALKTGLRLKRTSKYYGVYFNKGWKNKKSPWFARVKNGKNQKHIGCYQTELDALNAYNKYITEHSLKDALTNKDIKNNE